jgi:hypothetical protein
MRDGLRKILPEYRRKNEVEIAATPYNEGKITLREAAAIMDAPMRKTLEALGWEGCVSEIRNGRTWERILDDHCKRFHPAHPFWNDQAAPSSLIHVRSDRNW